MQKYSPISDDEPNMQEDSQRGTYYWCADVDALRGELHRIIATLWNDVDPQDYPEISDAVQIELAREL